MANQLRFDGRVAIVTGAGGGLGRAHAILLGSRGCKVVVNDLGGSMHGGGQDSTPAEKVVGEIKEAGGEAIANFDSVEAGDKIVKAALDAFGRVDIVVNNAGILRDTSFHKLSEEDWDQIYRVHVLGSFRVTRAAWDAMRDAGYGRIIFTASAAGIYGNFGQANYGMAKLGLVGLANTLAIEGRKRGILVNAIAPIAGSRMTETVLPKELVDALRPEYVSPLVAYLAHESCTETGSLFEVGGGFFAKLRWQRAEGKMFALGRPLNPEVIEKAWPEITHFDKATTPADITQSMAPVLSNLQRKSRGGNEFIDVDLALGAELPPITTSYTERDLALYALGVGVATDPLDPKELRYVYELHPEGFWALPTFGVVPILNALIEQAKNGQRAPGLNYGFDRILHGEQYLELKRPLPTAATLTHKGRIKDIWDKGRAAVVITEATSYDASGEELMRNELSTIVRGAGGFGGERGPSGEVNVPPDRAPDAVSEQPILANQALLYRLSGDWNPLHADPGFAKNFGFSRPILHGLCTFGHAAHAVIRAFSDNDPRYFKSIRARFAESVFPGETLVTEMWKESDTRIVFRARVKERDKVVLSHAAVELFKEIPLHDGGSLGKPSSALLPPSKPTAKPEAKGAAENAPAPAAASSPTSADIFKGIALHVESHPELVAQVGTVFQFKLTNPDSNWIIDVKNGKGAVKQGTDGSADVTLELSDADFLGMSSGKLNPQKLYFAGKLKLSGNIMAAQKLDFLQKIDQAKVKETMAASAPAPQASKEESAPVAPVKKEPVAPAIFKALGERLAKSPELAAEVGAVIAFQIKDPDSAFTADLTISPGSVKEGAQPGATTTVKLAEADLLALARGESPQVLFQRGALRVEGELRPAHKLAIFKGLV